MEADLSRYHRVDLLDLWRRPRRLTYRKVLALVSQLPPDSATASALRGGKPWWSIEAELLDHLRMNQLALGRVPVEKIQPHPLSPAAEPAGIEPRKLAALRAVAERARQDEERHAKEVIAHGC